MHAKFFLNQKIHPLNTKSAAWLKIIYGADNVCQKMRLLINNKIGRVRNGFNDDAIRGNIFGKLRNAYTSIFGGG